MTTVTFPRLLAKSSKTPDTPRAPETLIGHLDAVTRTAALLAEREGDRYLAALGLDAAAFGPTLRTALPRAALAHDLGKANSHFQRMVRADRTLGLQAVWHEQLSVWLILQTDPLRRWLFHNCDESVQLMTLAAVLGHHLRAKDGASLRLREQSGALQLSVLSGHPDFHAALRRGADLLGLPTPPRLATIDIDLVEPEVFDDPLQWWLREASAWWRSASPGEQRFVALLKALLVAADLAGSALPRLPADPAAWAAKALGAVCSAPELRRVVATRLREAEPRPFQRAVEASRSRITFVRAGCGSGKTAGAYLWAASRATGRKLFYCYPTTGTASQGFTDYVPPDQFAATLLHSRAPADLEDLLTNGYADLEGRLDWLTRYRALAAWTEPVTVCTVDSVLGLIQNNRVGLFSFPIIANGAFVFDEVHQYDDRLFGALLRFLETLRGVPVLLMTASLPRARFQALQKAVESMGERLEVIDGPPDLETLKRYRLEELESDRVWDRVVQAVGDGLRVLWVVNTVDRAIETAVRAEASGLLVLPYHSRYRYQDRLQRHHAVVEAFARDTPGGILAVTTQVCEVSLDLSADLLVSELAPIPALIQRLGRLNRRATPGGPLRPGRALIVEPPRPEPYLAADLRDARCWLQDLGQDPVSQADLAAALDQLLGDRPAEAAATSSSWLDGGILAWSAPLRQEGTTIPVIRAEDVARLAALARGERTREAIRLTIPMPLGPVARKISSWQREGAALVAPAGSIGYDERFGGRWR